jgi:hypothetical protein
LILRQTDLADFKRLERHAWNPATALQLAEGLAAGEVREGTIECIRPGGLSGTFTVARISKFV